MSDLAKDLGRIALRATGDPNEATVDLFVAATIMLAFAASVTSEDKAIAAFESTVATCREFFLKNIGEQFSCAH